MTRFDDFCLTPTPRLSRTFLSSIYTLIISAAFFENRCAGIKSLICSFSFRHPLQRGIDVNETINSICVADITENPLSKIPYINSSLPPKTLLPFLAYSHTAPFLRNKLPAVSLAFPQNIFCSCSVLVRCSTVVCSPSCRTPRQALTRISTQVLYSKTPAFTPIPVISK